MPVPWEAFIPFGKTGCGRARNCFSEPLIVGLLTGMYAATGTLFSVVKRGENDGKVCIRCFSAYMLLKIYVVATQI